MTTVEPVYWDPYDTDLVVDPYPRYGRLREESPLYYNEKYDFYAVSRFADCERGLPDWRTFSSARGDILEFVKSGIEIPPGTLIPRTTTSTGGCWPACSPCGGSTPSNLACGSTACAPWTRWSARAASTSFPLSARNCRCA